MTPRSFLRSLIVAGLLLTGAVTLSGCIVAPVGPGWYYGHPFYRWR